MRGGATLDTCDEFGETPLMKASEFGHAKILDLLLTAGADDRLTNAEGLGAFEMAERGLSYEATLHHGGECETCEDILRLHRQRSS